MDETLTLTLVGGPCHGRAVELDPRDAGLRIDVALWRDEAVALGRLTLPRLDALRGARWQLYQRDPEDPTTYRHAEDIMDRVFMYDPADAGDAWTWTGWGDWSDPPRKV